MRNMLIILIMLIAGSCEVRDVCSNEVIKEIYSPNDEFKAILFSRDCGATTSASTQVSILKADKKLKNESGNTFVTNMSQIKIEWQGNTHLTIYFDSLADIFEQKDKIQGIDITYKKL